MQQTPEMPINIENVNYENDAKTQHQTLNPPQHLQTKPQHRPITPINPAVAPRNATLLHCCKFQSPPQNPTFPNRVGIGYYGTWLPKKGVHGGKIYPNKHPDNSYLSVIA